MRYEPVGYIYGIEIGAMAVFLVIMLRYFFARRFPNQRNRLYAMIMWATVAYVMLDIASSLIIDNIYDVPLAATYVFNTSFYIITVLMLMLMMSYTFALVGYIGKERFKSLIPLLLPGTAIFLMLLANPLTQWLFYVDPEQGYVHAPLFMLIYVVSFVYLVFTLVVATRYRTAMRKKSIILSSCSCL